MLETRIGQNFYSKHAVHESTIHKSNRKIDLIIYRL